MKEREPLTGEWHCEGEMVEPPMKLTVDSKIAGRWEQVA